MLSCNEAEGEALIMAQGKHKGGDAPDQYIEFEEGSTVEGELDERTKLDIVKADEFIDRVSFDAMNDGMRMAAAAFEAFRDYVPEVEDKENAIEWAELVGDLVEVAVGAIFEHVEVIAVVMKEVIGVALKHAAIAGLKSAAPERRSVKDIAQHMIAEMAIQNAESGHKMKAFRETHRGEFRDAYLSASGDANAKKAACEKAMAAEGIVSPPPNAGRLIFTGMVERFNIDRWIEGCRTGKGKSTMVECATDAAIPGIKQDAEETGKEKFHEQDDDGKKHGKAMPTG